MDPEPANQPTNQLDVSFIDELYPVKPGETLSFGRSGDLIIDDSNMFMHRQVGAFLYHQELWWVRCDGKRTELSVRSDGGRRTELPVGEATALAGVRGVVRFEAGPHKYEIDYLLPGALELPTEDLAQAPPFDVTETRDFGVVSLNTEQRQLLAALGEEWMREPHAEHGALPTNGSIAHRLGWSVKKYDRKLDYLCSRLSDEGVPGLRGGKGIEASERRVNLVEHAIRNGLITVRDLDLLDDLN